MFRTYEEALKYIKARGDSHNPDACYIMTKDGNYNIAYGINEKEYAESLGYVIAAN